MRKWIVALVATMAVGCTDPAVRLANCVEGNVHRLGSQQDAALDCRCFLRQSGPVVIVLQPARVVSDTELSVAGLTADEIEDFRAGQLSLPSHENIQVIGAPPDLSYTSYHANFAHIETLQVARKASGPVRITLRRRRDHIAITDLQ